MGEPGVNRPSQGHVFLQAAGWVSFVLFARLLTPIPEGLQLIWGLGKFQG